MRLFKPLSLGGINTFQKKYENSSKAMKLLFRHIHPRKFDAMVDDVFAKEQLCKSVVEQVGQGILVTDNEWRITMANPEFGKIFGAEGASAVGMRTVDFLEPYLSQEQMGLLTAQIEARKKGEGGNYELVATVRGEKKTLAVTATPRKDKSGEVIGSIAVIEDITAKKEMQEKQAKLQDELLMFFEGVHHSPVAAVIIDPGGKAIYANESYHRLIAVPESAKIIGKVPETITGPSLSELWSGDDFGKMVRGEKGSLECETAYTSQDGAKHLLKTTISPIKRNGAVHAFLLIHEDVTSFADLARELAEINKVLGVKNASLEKMKSTLEHLIAIVAHDLKNPIQGLMGFCEIISEDFSEAPKELLGLVAMMQNAAHRMNLIIEDTTTLINREKYSPAKFNLSETIKQAVDLTKLSAERKSISLSVKDHNGEVFADERMTYTILRNLISNSIKFASKDGTGAIRVSAEIDGDFVRVSVADNGAGIGPERLGGIFELENGKNKSTKGTADEQGTGFGLPTCKEYVEEMGGRIWVESSTEADKHGTTFSFTLPRMPPPANAIAGE